MPRFDVHSPLAWARCSVVLLVVLAVVQLVSCHTTSSNLASKKPSALPEPGTRVDRRGDEIMVCGQLFHTGTKVVLWTDPGGFDAYRVQKHFVPVEESDWPGPTTNGPQSPNRYGLRKGNFPPEKLEQFRNGSWALSELQNVVDQFVIHYDGSLRSADTFKTLHDQRGLSCHFLLDVDGTIYQTLDLKERAWHATVANDRSIGIEIANLGAFPEGVWKKEFARYHSLGYGPGLLSESVLKSYAESSSSISERAFSWGLVSVRQGASGAQEYVFDGPVSRGPIFGRIHEQKLWQMDFTPSQYIALAQLTMALTRVFPNLPATYPQDEQGNVLARQLTSEEFSQFRGVLGHYHIQSNKIDPGPAFQWEWLMRQVKAGKIVDRFKVAQD